MKKILIILIFINMVYGDNKLKNRNDANNTNNIKQSSANKTIEIKQNGTTFYVTQSIVSKNKELIKMILLTESMDDDERQYWFDIMPSMTKKQIDRIYNILDTERKKLEALEIKYQKEIKALNEKHLIEWQEFQVKSKQNKEANSTSKDYYIKMIKKINEIKDKK
jgi:vacuolar-type H+-ATPase subunit I/STV1